MQDDIKNWYDALGVKWSENYSGLNEDFNQRLINVHRLAANVDINSQVLDIGCATGEIAYSLASRFKCQATGIDLSPRMVECCQNRYKQNNMHFQAGDITDLPCKENTFDLVISMSVIEWVEDYEKAIAEVCRVLKPQGQWIVSIPNWRSPFRKLELVRSYFIKDSYLKLQKNRLGISRFREIAGNYGFNEKASIFHVMPFYSKELRGKLAALLGMMCTMSFICNKKVEPV